MDVDFNQTITFTTNNPIFNITDNRLILNRKLSHEKWSFMPLFIRATDNGQPPTFVNLISRYC